MIFVFVFFILVSLLFLYGIWFLPQDGKMMAFGERIAATLFISLFLIVGLGGIYWTYIYEPAPIKINVWAGKVMDSHDANKSGKVELISENTVIRCESSISCRTYNYYSLFKKADQNLDSLVTWEELAAVAKDFDTNNNGKLEYNQELKKLHKAYPQYISNGFRKENTRFRKEPLVE